MRLLVAIALVGSACAEDVLPPRSSFDLAAGVDDLAVGVDLAQSSALDDLAPPLPDIPAGLLCAKYGQPTPIDFIGAPYLVETQPAANAPPSLGGDIVDGIYVRTRVTYYSGTSTSTSTNTKRALLILERGAWFYRDSGNVVDPLAYAGGFLTVTNRSVQFGYPPLCGTGGTPYPYLGYTATPTTFTTYWAMQKPRTGEVETEEMVYTRQ